MLDHMLISRNPLAHYRGSEIHNDMGGRMDFPTLSSRTSFDTIEVRKPTGLWRRAEGLISVSGTNLECLLAISIEAGPQPHWSSR
jgi:hypothetical protein